MEVEVTVRVPQLIYDIYADAAKNLGISDVEHIMSSALLAYAQHLFEEMLENGELQDDK